MRNEAVAMRSLASLYLAIGIVLMLIGFVATGPCRFHSGNVVGDVVFVLGWPVYLYDNVAHRNLDAPQWLHQQVCQAGTYRTARLATD
jgi:hypothetical protein